MFKQTFLYFIISTCSSRIASGDLNLINEINKENLIVTYQCVQCVMKVISKNINRGEVISVITNDDPLNNDIIKALSNDIFHSLIIRSKYKQNWLVPTDAYAILTKNLSELALTLSELSKDLLWNPDGKFIIRLYKAINISDIREIFKELLKYRIYKVLLLHSINSKDILIYTYLPFINNNCGNHFDDVITIGNCNNVLNVDKLTFNKHYKNYRNCSVVVGLHEVVPYVVTRQSRDLNVAEEYKYGIEQIILESIATLEGIKIEYKFFSNDVDRGVVLSNNTGTGILGYLQNGDISIAVGGYILILNRVSICDYIWGYNYADLKIVTQSATEIVWKKVYRTFGIQSWLYVACSFCVMCVVTLIILNLWLKKRHNSISITLKLLDYLLDHSDDGLFNNRNLRLLLICWIWYTYFITSFYKTAYYSLITGHVKEKRDFEPTNLNTFPYEPCISDVGRSFFLYAYNLTFPYSKKIDKCQTTDGGLDYVVDNSDYYTTVTEYVYFLKAPKYIDEEGNFKLDSWDILSGTISTFYCTRGFGLRKQFQTHAMNIFETGLLQFRLNMMKAKRRHFTQNNKRYFKSLHFSDFRVSYYILIIGSILSLFCFLIERYHYVNKC